VSGRAGWVSFALALPRERLAAIATSYDQFGALLHAVALEFTVEVRDAQTGGNIKDTRRVSKTIQRRDMQVLCGPPDSAPRPAPAVAHSFVAGLLPGNGTRFDNARSDGGQLRSLRARALSTLLLLGSDSAFQDPARMHDSLTAHTVVALYFTSNIKLFKALQMLRGGSAFEAGAQDSSGALTPTASFLRVCPPPGADENATRGCRTHVHARARVLDFQSNSIHQMRSLQSLRSTHVEPGAVAAWVAATGRLQPGFLPDEVYNHSRAVGAAYGVNSRFRQGYLLAPQGALPAQFLVTAVTWCVHSPAARAQLVGEFTVVVWAWLPVRGASFLDEPFWGETYASALRELLGLFPLEATVNSSGVRRDANESLFEMHIVLPHAEPRVGQDQAARLAGVLGDRASGFATRVQALVVGKLRAYFPDAALLLPRAALPPAEVRRSAARGADPPALARCGPVHITTHAFADTNNADGAARAFVAANPASPQGRVLQLTAELTAEEFCAAGSEPAVLLLVRSRFNSLFVAASGGTIASIQPTAAVVATDFECPGAGGRRLLAEGVLRILVEIVLTPTSALEPMLIRATEAMYALGVRNVLIEPSALADDIQVSRVSAEGDWLVENDGTYSPLAPKPVLAPVVVTRPGPAVPAPRTNNSTAPPDGDAHALFLVNVYCTALAAFHTVALALAMALSPCSAGV
jgi:hypothetical protein